MVFWNQKKKKFIVGQILDLQGQAWTTYGFKFI